MPSSRHLRISHRLVAALIFTFGLIATSGHAWAVPAFNRQTGQNCVACHAGGQFPELTPYGRLFKLTGYTLGSRDIPLSVMCPHFLTDAS